MILVFESHPVQYRSPLYREVSRRLPPGTLRVVYGSDFSVRDYRDREFGQAIDWGTDLLSGIDHQFTDSLRRIELDRWSALSRNGVRECFDSIGSISGILLTSLRFEFDWAALFAARRRSIPVLLRSETQDLAFERSRAKQLARDVLYRFLYAHIDQVLPIGKLNAAHYSRLGRRSGPEHFVRYAVPNPVALVSVSERESRALNWRRARGIDVRSRLIGFSGKLVEKKNPLLILEAVRELDRGECANPIEVVFVGAGPLRDSLEAVASDLDIPVHFTGFLDQREITDAYLAIDVLVLPSRRQGETWGLVVNEALQAGCAVAVSDAVGCSVEFGGWERVKVFPDGDAEALRDALRRLLSLGKDWDWAIDPMRLYSIDAAADALAQNLRPLMRAS